MKDGFRMDPEISATDSSSFMHGRLIQVPFVIVRLTPCVATWVLSLILCTPKYLFDAGQSLEFPLVKTVTAPGKKNKNHSRSDEQCGMSRYVVCLLSTPWPVRKPFSH